MSQTKGLASLHVCGTPSQKCYLPWFFLFRLATKSEPQRVIQTEMGNGAKLSFLLVRVPLSTSDSVLHRVEHVMY